MKSILFLTIAGLFSAGLGRASTVYIAGDSNAATGNFQSPGATANVGYSITSSDDGTNFNVDLESSDPTALQFANLYFDTIASTPGTGSNLGFEFGATPTDAFDPDSGTKYSLAGTGVTDSVSVLNGVTSIMVVIPNSFFLTNPLGMPFTPTPPGTEVSIHLSQSFSYSVVGGSANFAPPQELGVAIVGSIATPEPGSLSFIGLGLGALGFMARKLRK